MKKVVILTFVYEQSGGTRTVIEGLAKYHTQKGEKVKIVVVVSPTFRDYPFSPLNKICYLNTEKDFALYQTYFRWQKIIDQEQPDRVIVVLGHPFCAHLASILPLSIRKKTILYFLDPWFTLGKLKDELRAPVADFIEKRNKILGRLFDNRSHVSKIFQLTQPLDKITAVEIYEKEWFRAFKGIMVCTKDVGQLFRQITSSRTKIVVNPLYYEPQVKNPDYYWEKPSTIELIFTGRVTSSWKGFGLVLKALQKIKDFKLYLYTWDKNEVQIARELFRVYKLPLDQLITKSEAKTEDFLVKSAQVTAVLIPSLGEGFSFTMLECLSMGAIVIVGPFYGGPKEVIKHLENGIRFRPGDADDLAEKIILAHQLEGGKLQEIRKAALSTVKRYTYQSYLQRYEKGFKD